MRAMMRDVVVRDLIAKEPDLAHEIHVLRPVPVRELIPRTTNFFAQLGETFGRGKAIASGRLHLSAGAHTIALSRYDPGVGALGKERLRRRERDDVDVGGADCAMCQRYLDGKAWKAEVVFDAGDAFLLKGKEDSIGRTDARRRVVADMNSEREGHATV